MLIIENKGDLYDRDLQYKRLTAHILFNKTIQCLGPILSEYTVLASASCVPESIPHADFDLYFGTCEGNREIRKPESRRTFRSADENLAILKVSFIAKYLWLTILINRIF